MIYNNLSDAELISHYSAGHEEAFAVLLNRHKAKVFTKILFITKSKVKAEDILQEVFIKVIKVIKSGRYTEEGKFTQWIMRIANNMAIDNFRKEKRTPMITVEDGSNIFNNLKFSEDSYESYKIKEESHALVRGLVEKLPDSQREVLIMRHFDELSFQEIAEATNVSINTALGRMRYALINLRKMLEKNKIRYGENHYSE